MLGACTQPPTALQESVVQTFASSQLNAGPGTQVPPMQTSEVVQTLLSVQARLLKAFTQPAVLSQLSSVHPLPSLQAMAVPGTHPPAWQASPRVQTLPSVHATVLLLVTQPLAGAHASTVQGLPSLQTSAAPGTHWPAKHASPTVQVFASVQLCALAVCTHPWLGSQLSSVHGLPSSQPAAKPG